MQPKQIKRQHIDHQHQMSVSLPQADKRLIIPEDTFMQLDGPKFSLPFRYLFTWFFSLLALIALPIGLMLVYVGGQLQDSNTNWQQMSATVVQVKDDGLVYKVDSVASKSPTEFNFALDKFVTANDGEFQLHFSACDLVSRFIVPQEEGASFSVWANPNDKSQQSCVPVDTNSGEMYFTVGMIILLLCAWRLIRTIHAAGQQPKKA